MGIKEDIRSTMQRVHGFLDPKIREQINTHKEETKKAASRFYEAFDTAGGHEGESITEVDITKILLAYVDMRSAGDELNKLMYGASFSQTKQDQLKQLKESALDLSDASNRQIAHFYIGYLENHFLEERNHTSNLEASIQLDVRVKKCRAVEKFLSS